TAPRLRWQGTTVRAATASPLPSALHPRLPKQQRWVVPTGQMDRSPPALECQAQTSRACIHAPAGQGTLAQVQRSSGLGRGAKRVGTMHEGKSAYHLATLPPFRLLSAGLGRGHCADCSDQQGYSALLPTVLTVRTRRLCSCVHSLYRPRSS